MSYAFHRSVRHGPNTRYFPELHSHPTGINAVALELTSPLTFTKFGHLIVMYVRPGHARKVQLLIQMAFPHLQTFVPLTPLRWITKDMASPEVQRGYREQFARRYRYHPDRSKHATSPDHPESDLAPTLTEMFAPKKLDFYLRFTQRIAELVKANKHEQAQKLLQRTDIIPIKMALQCQAIFDNMIFIGVPQKIILPPNHQGQSGSQSRSVPLGLRLVESAPPTTGPSKDLHPEASSRGSFLQKKGPTTNNLDNNTDHLGLTQTDLARKYKVPLVGRRLRRRDEAPFPEEAEVQPDAWWEDPASYLPGRSKKYLPPPKAYVEWLSEERALLTPHQLHEAISEQEGQPLPTTESIRVCLEEVASELLDCQPIRDRCVGFYFIKDQNGAFNEIRALTYYLRRHRPHPKTEQNAGRLNVLQDKEFWRGLTTLHNPFRLQAALQPEILNLGERCGFSKGCTLYGLSGTKLRGYRSSPGFRKFLKTGRNGKPRSKRMQRLFADWFKKSLPSDVPKGCELVLVEMPALQQYLVAVVETRYIMPMFHIPAVRVVPFLPTDFQAHIGNGRKMIVGRNGVYNSRNVKMMDVGLQPNTPQTVIDMYRDIGMAFGVKPSMLKKVLAEYD